MAVNWELLSGDAVADLAAALIIMSRPDGNQITPSRGDRGIDIQVTSQSGVDIYQVKKYTRPLTPRQQADVKDSWDTFVRDGLPGLNVTSWTLVTPWNPTHDRNEWLQDLTAGQPFPRHWLGRTQLDVLAAARPDIVDYYTGDGSSRVLELMASALAAAREIPAGTSNEQLLAAVVERHQQLGVVSSQINPFYRYDVQIRPGRLTPELEWPAPGSVDSSAALVQYEGLNDDQHLAVLIFPTRPESTFLAPIRFRVQFAADEESAAELRRFAIYGAPLDRHLATVTETAGPPGTIRPGPGLFSAKTIGLPRTDLELRLTPLTGPQRTIPLTETTITTGPEGTGMRLVGQDRSGFLRVEAMFGAEDEHDTINLDASTERSPLAVQMLPTLEWLLGFDREAVVELAAEGGLPFVGGWQPEPMITNPDGVLALIRALTTMQRHTHIPVRCPPTFDGELRAAVIRVAKLLEGETLSETWTAFTATSTAPPTDAGDEFQLMLRAKMTILLGEDLITFDREEVRHLPSVRLDPAFRKAGQTRFIPGLDPTVISIAMAISMNDDTVTPNVDAPSSTMTSEPVE